MIKQIDFKFGLIYKGLVYGWYKKNLFRLPCLSEKGVHLPTKKLECKEVGKKTGYRLGGDRKSLKQLRDMTVSINRVVTIVKDENVPW